VVAACFVKEQVFWSLAILKCSDEKNKFRCYPQQLESFCVFAIKSVYAIKNKMQPTNPSAHTYVNGDDVKTPGNAAMQNTFLKQFIYTVLYI
jgi:hypothetical protein